MYEHSDAETKARSIVSIVLDDGTIVETLHKPSEIRTGLIAYRAGETRQGGFLELPRIGRVTPYSATNNLLAHRVVLFASAAEPFDSVTSLVAEIRAFIHRYADLSEGFEEIASYYVVLTWIYDAFNEVPYLRLQGDFGSGKSRCLQTIGSLCYKPMFVSGASTVSPIFRIIDAFRGTLVVDESDFRFSDEKAEIIKILNNGNAAGFPVLRSEATPTKEFNPRAFNVFGPKIIASRTLFDDRALESRCITEVMSGLPPRPDIPLSLPVSFQDEARCIRNKLLQYRFEYFHASRDLTAIRSAKIEARVAQVFAPLLSVVDDPKARARIIKMAEGESVILSAERGSSVEAKLLGIIERMRREAATMSVKEIAERFSDQFASEYDRPITARWIGAQLRKRLSLTPVKSHGIFTLAGMPEDKLASLFARYGIGDDRVDVGTLGTSVPLPTDESIEF